MADQATQTSPAVSVSDTEFDEVISADLPAITEADVLAREAEEGFPREIVDGRWIEEVQMAGQRHGLISGEVFALLHAFVKANKLGQVYPDGTTYVLSGDGEGIKRQRIPDVSFVAEAKVDRSNAGLMYFAPDLAVEVLSPTEKPVTTLEKVVDYLHGGTAQIWVIDPELQQVTVYQQEASTRIYGAEDEVSGGELLPEFVLPVATLFES